VALTWEEARSFCEWSGGRLPTEAEWEYTAGAGSTAGRYDALDSIAWYGDNSGKSRIDSKSVWNADPKYESFEKKLFDNGNEPHPVAGKQPNAWKLYAILGNAWEWTADWYREKYYDQREERDPRGPALETSERFAAVLGTTVLEVCACRTRNKVVPGARLSHYGARFVVETFP
jgi:formylglycine-generating enzyme required for sulfatase activity